MPEYICKDKNDAVFVCISKDCTKHGFICLNTQCCSQNQHKSCNLIPIDQFHSIQLKGDNQSSFDNYMSKFTKFYQSIIKRATSQLKFLNDWSQCHHKRLTDLAMYKQNCQFNLSGDYLGRIIQGWTVFSEEYWNSINEQFQELQANIEKQLNSMKKTYTRAKKKIEQERDRISASYNSIEVNSSIVWKQQQLQSLYELLTAKQSKIKQLKCLYRASLNSFSAQQFHRSCDGYQNTVLLVKNSKGKIIGGFTSLCWEEDEFGQYKKDQQERSFVFSLSNQQIYPLFQKQYAIQCNKSCGPIFGRGATIWVYDKADTNSAYWYILPSTYHPQKSEWTEQTFQQFIGAKMYERFTLVQWEVFQVIYE